MWNSQGATLQTVWLVVLKLSGKSRPNHIDEPLPDRVIGADGHFSGVFFGLRCWLSLPIQSARDCGKELREITVWTNGPFKE